MKKQFQHLLFAIILIAASVTAHAQSGLWLTTGNTGANGFKLGTTTGFDWSVIANNKTRMTFKKAPTNSSIEIGANSPIPNYGVHIVGGVNNVLSQGLYIQRTDAPPGNQDGALAIAITGSPFVGTNIAGGSCNFILHSTINSPTPDMEFSANNITPQLIIKNNGNIGIGTSAPTQALHINNGALFITGTNSNGGPMLLLGGGGVSDPNGEWGLEYTNPSSLPNRGLNFWKPFGSTGGGGNYFLFLSDNGNIGVGTGTPTDGKLQVNRDVAPTGSYASYRGVLSNIQNTSPVPNGGAIFSIVGTEGDATVGNFTPILGFAYGVLGQALNGEGNYGGYFNAVGPSTGPTDGNYGIYASGSGNTNSALNWGGYFAGNVIATAYYTMSDQKLKNNIKPLTGALDKLMLLKPSTYTFKTEEFKPMNLPHGNQIGLIAQDLQTVFPELVVDMPEMKIKNSTGDGMITNPTFKAVQYIGLIPVLIAGVQEQQKQITEQKQANDEDLQEINDLKAQLTTMNARLDLLEKAQGSTFDPKSQSGTFSGTLLDQIAPNPFSQNATITFSLPSDVSNAQLIITDVTGKTVITYALSNGATQQVVSANSFVAGTYQYSLMVNGKIIDSKQMVIVK